jgi:hypothetical protein
METCAGCDVSALSHPFVAVMRENGTWVKKPVCTQCWLDPTHRTTPLKAHFFSRAQGEAAVAAAGSSTISGG